MAISGNPSQPLPSGASDKPAARKPGFKHAAKALLKAVIPARHRLGLKRSFNRVRYFGLHYRCPFCHSHLRTFLPFGLDLPVFREKQVIGGGYRLNSCCPVCACVDRERLLYVYIWNRTDIPHRRGKLLHVAPEGNLKSILQRTRMDYLTADLCSDKVMVKMDITDIQYPKDHFDVIICNHVLEHVIDDHVAISELYRVLKPGGWAILQVPLCLSLEQTFEDPSVTDPSERERVFGQSDHVRIYGRDYRTRLEKAGFEVRPFEWWKEEGFGGAANRFGFIQNETLYLAIKPCQESVVPGRAAAFN